MKRAFFLTLCMLGTIILISTGYSQTFRDLFMQATRYAEEGNHEKAVELYEQAIEINPNFAPAYNNLGLSYQAMNLDLAEVAWYFKTAIDIDPKFEDAYVNLAKAYYNLGYFDLAEKHCQDALQINPNSFSAKLSLGWIYLLGKSQPQEAIYYFKQVSDAVSHPSAFFGLGMAYFMAGERPEVLGCITTLREMKEDGLAAQLEDIVRSSDYVASSPQGTPLLEEATDQRDPFAVPPARSQFSTRVSPAGPTQIQVTGTIPVRLTGSFFSEGEEGEPGPQLLPPPTPPYKSPTTKVLKSQ